MTSLNSQHEKILVAFSTALGRQDESLPSGLQQQLHAIGQNLEARIVELPTIAASLPTLNQAYEAALADAQTDAGEQGATLVSTSQDHSSKFHDRAVQIFTAPDPVQAAQRNLPGRFGQVASNPLKRFFGRG
jgi:ABC-type transporter Mla subunit MlaD